MVAAEVVVVVVVIVVVVAKFSLKNCANQIRDEAIRNDSQTNKEQKKMCSAKKK